MRLRPPFDDSQNGNNNHDRCRQPLSPVALARSSFVEILSRTIVRLNLRRITQPEKRWSRQSSMFQMLPAWFPRQVHQGRETAAVRLPFPPASPAPVRGGFRPSWLQLRRSCDGCFAIRMAPTPEPRPADSLRPELHSATIASAGSLLLRNRSIAAHRDLRRLSWRLVMEVLDILIQRDVLGNQLRCRLRLQLQARLRWFQPRTVRPQSLRSREFRPPRPALSAPPPRSMPSRLPAKAFAPLSISCATCFDLEED